MSYRLHPLVGEAPLPDREVRWCLTWLDHHDSPRWCCPRGGTVGLLARDMRVFERRNEGEEDVDHAWEIRV